MSTQCPRLTDTQMASFITRGYITVTPDLSPDFHANVFAQFEQVFEKEGNPGNNLLPRLPSVRQIFDAPIVRGALQSLLGDDYYLQPHRHPHHNPAKSTGQTMHQDGGKRWSHRTRYLLAFYYPQDTPVERGPSGIVPGSHYFNTPEGACIDQETPLVSNAGTVTLAHYDLWHRAMPNQTNQNRFMVKFLFARMSEPQKSSWNNTTDTWPGSAKALADDDDTWQETYARVWDWHRGKVTPHPRPTPSQSMESLLSILAAPVERSGIRAAYSISCFGAVAVPLLLELLTDPAEMTRRHACYALSLIGTEAVQPLIDTLTHENATTRADAAIILGDIGLAASAAVPQLIHNLNDAAANVRTAAAEALGLVCQSKATAVLPLCQALSDADPSVRTAATFALNRLGPHAVEAVEFLENVLEDENRYVRGDALHALQRIGTPAAKDTLVRHLMPARWCPITTPENTF